MDTQIFSNFVIKKFYSASTMFTGECVKSERKNRGCWAIVIKSEGETIYNCCEKKYISNINNVMVLPKGSTYEWKCLREGHFSVIEFECDKTYDEIFSFEINNGEKLLKIFKSLEYSMAIHNPYFELEAIKDCYKIILFLLNFKKSKYFPDKKQSKITPAIDYIAKNYNKEIKNDKLAQLCGLSTVYFRKLFTEFYGVSPITFVHQLRIKKAKEMLKSDYGSITDIAFSLGYLNVYDFSRDFKKHTGVPPSKY